MMAAMLSLTLLGVGLGFLLALASRYLRVEGNPLADEVNALLPGANCGQCGYAGCAAAAVAMAAGNLAVTACPPGGRALAEQLAAKLGVSVDLDAVADRGPLIAVINEALCIGCARCLKQCATDAIIGAPKQIHAVLQEACSGCGQCITVCPQDGMQLQPIPTTLRTWHWPKPAVGAAV